MDRVIWYTGELLRSQDLLSGQKDSMYGVGGLAQSVLGNGTVVAGLAINPTSPATLSVTIGAGQIYTLTTADATPFGGAGTDSNSIVKQGLLNSPATLTITPPGTSGYSQVYLVQVQYSDQDTGSTVLPYYNAANPSAPYSGPNNSGISQYTARQGVCVVALKAGAAAPTGSQVTPSADVGYTGLYAITVANGQTTITTANISQLANAPFFTPLPQIPAASQAGSWNTATAGGTANALTATLVPAPAGYTTGLAVELVITTPNTGAATLNLNGLGVVPITTRDGNPLVANDLNGIVTLEYSAGAFVLSNVTVGSETARGVVQLAAAPTVAAGVDLTKPPSVGRTAAAVQAGNWTFAPPGGTANALTVSLTPAPTSYSAGMVVRTYVTVPNTGAATINVNGLGAKNILNSDWSPLAPGDLMGTLTLTYDGTQFTFLKSSTASETSRGFVQLADAPTVAAGVDLTKPPSVGRTAAAVQAGQWSYAADTGAVNALVANLTPAATAYYAGFSVTVKVANTNTGAATVNVNGIGAKSIVHKDGTALQPRELQAGQIAFLTYDGTNFQFDVSYGRLLSVQTFTATGTYTPTPGMAFVRVRMVGGGGAGAGGNANPSGGTVTLGAPGGAATYAEGKFSSAQIGASQPVTIGAGGVAGINQAGLGGGTTSLGSLMTAPGGIGGSQLVNQVPPTVNGNGNSSTAPSGANIIGFSGGGGVSAFGISTTIGVGGVGGVGASGPLGNGGPGLGANANGISASGYGAGGSGVFITSAMSTGTSGGNGSPGYMIIEEYSL